MTTGGPPRVAIIEDHTLFAQSLEIALEIEGYDVRRIPLPEDKTALSPVLAATLRTNPRIVLLDLDLGPYGAGERLIGPLVKFGASVLVVTGSDDRPRWAECLRFGATKVLRKTTTLDEILETVRLVLDRRPVMTLEEREELLRLWHQERLQTQYTRQQLDQLSPREREVLGWLMQGKGVREIASADVVSEATVRTQVKSILAKLGVSSQLAAVGLAHRAGWRPNGD